MTEQITNTPTRDDFFKFVDNLLKSYGFKKDPEKESWCREKQIKTGGRMMIINGQHKNIPGEIHNIGQMVEVYGEGSIKDDQSEIPMIQIDFGVSENDKIDYVDPQMCFFYDDQSLFSNIINQIFR